MKAPHEIVWSTVELVTSAERHVDYMGGDPA
jgi:hypothetical protein